MLSQSTQLAVLMAVGQLATVLASMCLPSHSFLQRMVHANIKLSWQHPQSEEHSQVN